MERIRHVLPSWLALTSNLIRIGYDFLYNLNMVLDEVCDMILGIQPLPNIREIFCWGPEWEK